MIRYRIDKLSVSKPGPLVFDFWTLLVTLLQADDLEVKDVVACISSKLRSSETGEFVAAHRAALAAADYLISFIP